MLDSVPLVFVDSVYFSNNLLNNLVKNSGENDFYHPSQEFNVNGLDLVKKRRFFPTWKRQIL